MMVNSEVLRERLNDKSTTDWIDGDKSSLSYKQGFLSGLIKALTIVGEVEYFTKHGCDRAPIELDLDDEVTEGLKIVTGAISDKLKELELASHSERHIVEGCIGLMESVHQNMLEYMQYMGFEYDRENEEIVTEGGLRWKIRHLLKF